MPWLAVILQCVVSNFINSNTINPILFASWHNFASLVSAKTAPSLKLSWHSVVAEISETHENLNSRIDYKQWKRSGKLFFSRLTVAYHKVRTCGIIITCLPQGLDAADDLTAPRDGLRFEHRLLSRDTLKAVVGSHLNLQPFIFLPLPEQIATDDSVTRPDHILRLMNFHISFSLQKPDTKWP